jgi:hypothetical protein
MAVLGASGALLALDAGCSSFGSTADPAASPVDASSDGAAPSDGSTDGASGDDAGTPLGAKYCEGKVFTVCSDFEPPIKTGTAATLAGGWSTVDPGKDLVVELVPAVPAGSRGQGLHVKVPYLADAGDSKQALRAEVPSIPSSLVFAATMQMAVNSVTQYTEPLSIVLDTDPRHLQIVVELLDGNLAVTESSNPTVGNTVDELLLSIGALTALQPVRVEVRLWFGATNEIEVAVDGAVKLARSQLKTAPLDKPTGALLFSAGYAFSQGADGKNGGGYYLDDVILQTTP